MKKLILILLSACMLVGALTLCASAADNHYGKSYTAPYGTPTIDGKGTDAVWELARWENINVNAASDKMTARFKILHDDNLLYFLVEISDLTNRVSTALNENVWLQLHTHTCSDLASCTTFSAENMNIKGKIWDIKNEVFLSSANYKLTSEQSGVNTVYTLEWSKTPAISIPTDSQTPFGLEWVADDYTYDGTYIGNLQTWNAYSYSDSQKAGNFGSLYFLTEAETAALPSADFYNDVLLTDEAYEAIRYTSSLGIFVPASESNPSFYPERKLSRAQFVTILGRLANADVSGYSTTAFTDVDFVRDAWYAKYAEWARVNGIVVGSSFMANKEITVAEAVVMLQRYAKNIEDSYTEAKGTLDNYDDAGVVPAWATEAMLWVTKNGLYPFSGTALSPTKTMTRAMAAMLVYNYDTTVVPSGTDGAPNISYQEPPQGIDWTKQASINALEFGFVNDGVTPNDGIMAYYLEHYSDSIPLEFPNGKYVFKHSINFPKRIYLELAPRAELILDSETVQDFFITMQKGVSDYGSWDDYAHQSYIRGGTINANYKAKVALALHGGLHTYFEGFKIYNVLEKGIQTEVNDFHNGCYNFRGIYLYNDKAIEGTIAIYDNQADNIYTECTAVNFQTFIYTSGGKFSHCSAWFNTYGKSLIPNSVFAYVIGGNQSVFTQPCIDTYRTGFKLVPNESGSYPSTSISDLVWITNNDFYTCGQYKDNPDDNLQRDYPMIIFDVASDRCRVMVNGMYIPWREWGFRFSNIALPSSSFIHVRYEAGWDPWNHMANFRDDTTRLKEGKNLYNWSDMPPHNAWSHT